MRAVTVVSGPVAALDRASVDTDQIIPKQFLKRIERTGFGEFLFYDWMKDPGFALRRPEFASAPILATGPETTVTALMPPAPARPPAGP